MLFLFAVYCQYPGTIPNGTIRLVGAMGKYEYRSYIRTIVHREQIEYQCDKEFVRIGPPAATCVDGEWSPPELPECRLKKHPRMLYIFRGRRDISQWRPSRGVGKRHQLDGDDDVE